VHALQQPQLLYSRDLVDCQQGVPGQEELHWQHADGARHHDQSRPSVLGQAQVCVPNPCQRVPGDAIYSWWRALPHSAQARLAPRAHGMLLRCRDGARVGVFARSRYYPPRSQARKHSLGC
ncbi:hypothetical protein DYB35_002822, partial [Aphanomyces astaci]